MRLEEKPFGVRQDATIQYIPLDMYHWSTVDDYEFRARSQGIFQCFMLDFQLLHRASLSVAKQGKILRWIHLMHVSCYSLDGCYQFWSVEKLLWVVQQSGLSPFKSDDLNSQWRNMRLKTNREELLSKYLLINLAQLFQSPGYILEEYYDVI